MQDQDLLRYSRQIMLKQTGIEAQEKLLKSKVMIVGAGGLGCSNALYLAGSGVGSMFIIDNDKIEISNLPRQILFSDEDIGKYKAETAVNKLQSQFSELSFEFVNTLFSDAMVSEFQPDIIIDAGDNLLLTHRIGEIAEKDNIPVIHASVNRMEGHIYSYLPEDNFPTLKKIFPSTAENETCSQLGVMTVAVGLISSLQAMQCIRVLLSPALGGIKPEMTLFDGLSMKFMTIKV